MAAVNYTMTNAGLNMLRDGTEGANNPKVLYFALGSGTTAPQVTDTKLTAETFRKAVTSYANGVNPGEIVFSCYLAPGDAVGLNIQEVGWFGGNAATTTKDSGVLLAHGLYIHNPKVNTESIQFTLDLTI